MDQKQKERLRVLLKARKRADQVLAQRHAAERKKQDREQRLKANQALRLQYEQEFTALAQACGLIELAEQAARERGGSLTCELSCYIDYGMSSSCLQHAAGAAPQGALRPSHLALRIIWQEAGVWKGAEARVHRRGQVTFHNNPLPIFRFLWRSRPRILQKMLDSALRHPITSPVGAQKEP